MKPGMVSITFRELSHEKILEIVSECGLKGIEWGGDVHVPHGDVDTAKKVAILTTQAGLEITSYGSYYRFEECDIDSEMGGPSMQSVLDTAEAMEAQAIRVWVGSRGPKETSPEVWAAIVHRAHEFAEECARRGMRLDFEYHSHTLTETPESTCRLLKEIDHPAARTLWQPPLETSPEERLAGLRKVKPLVSSLHCNYFDQDAWPNQHALEEGASEWASYLAEFRSDTTDRWILLEHVKDHSVEQFKKDAQTLLRWIG